VAPVQAAAASANQFNAFADFSSIQSNKAAPIAAPVQSAQTNNLFSTPIQTNSMTHIYI